MDSDFSQEGYIYDGKFYRRGDIPEMDRLFDRMDQSKFMRFNYRKDPGKMRAEVIELREETRLFGGNILVMHEIVTADVPLNMID